MLSVDKCRKILGRDDLSNEEIQEIRDTLYSLGEILVNSYIGSSTRTDDKKRPKSDKDGSQ